MPSKRSIPYVVVVFCNIFVSRNMYYTWQNYKQVSINTEEHFLQVSLMYEACEKLFYISRIHFCKNIKTCKCILSFAVVIIRTVNTKRKTATAGKILCSLQNLRRKRAWKITDHFLKSLIIYSTDISCCMYESNML